MTKEIWHQLNWIWPDSVLYMEFMDWFTWFFENNSTIQYRFCVCALWAIWTKKNKLVHERQKKTGLAIANFITNYV